MPKRIQRRRTKGWRKPEGAVYVGRGTKWGNPARVIEGGCNPKGYFAVIVGTGPKSCLYGGYDRTRAHQVAAGGYREQWAPLHIDEIRAELAGKDLMCWCPLDQPCHADVLLELANGGESK